MANNLILAISFGFKLNSNLKDGNFQPVKREGTASFIFVNVLD